MNRLKFLIFALMALGLWGYHLMLVSPAMASRAADQASKSAAGAPAAVALRIESQRSQLQAAVIHLAGTPAVLNMGARAGADRFAAVRNAAEEPLPAELRESLVIALVTENGTLLARGKTEPAPPAEGFSADLARSSTGGKVVKLGEAPHLFYSVPLLVSDKNEVRAGGWAMVGLPVLPDPKAVADAVLKDYSLSGLALLAEGKVVVSAGPQKALAEGALKTVKTGQSGVMLAGPLESLGPLALPMLVDASPQEVAVRREIANTPWEVVAVSSAAPAIAGLVSYQKFALLGLVGLLLMMVVVALLIRGAAAAEDEDEAPRMVAPAPAPSAPKAPPAEAAKPNVVPEHAPAPEASPDDFHFPPAASESRPPGPPPEPQQDPFAMAAAPPARQASLPPVPTAAQAAYQPPAPAAPPQSFQPTPKGLTANSLFDEDEENARTMAYPTLKQGADPFAQAAAQQPASDYNPDATRVAAMPPELIKAARSGTGMSGERPALRPPSQALPAPKIGAVGSSPPASDEERHFQDVFRDFVATREKCREPSDGLTYDKFKAKLLKNKEQLVQKYNCKSVRFQVYVKEGKAALKATPVKD